MRGQFVSKIEQERMTPSFKTNRKHVKSIIAKNNINNRASRGAGKV
jgi:hypothetical protein